jgi:3-deoxy-7-phosphoheptulonate synthase
MGALAAGAHGIIVEVHPDPTQAMSDGAQSLDLEGFKVLAKLVHPEQAGQRKRLRT